MTFQSIAKFKLPPHFTTNTSSTSSKQEPKNHMSLTDIKANGIFEKLLEGSPYTYENIPVITGKGRADIILKTEDGLELHIPVNTYISDKHLTTFKNTNHHQKRFYENNRNVDEVLVLKIRDVEGEKCFDQEYDPKTVLVGNSGFPGIVPIFIESRVPIKNDVLTFTTRDSEEISEELKQEFKNINDLLVKGVAVDHGDHRWRVKDHPTSTSQLATPNKIPRHTTLQGLVGSLMSQAISRVTANMRGPSKTVPPKKVENPNLIDSNQQNRRAKAVEIDITFI